MLLRRGLILFKDVYRMVVPIFIYTRPSNFLKNKTNSFKQEDELRPKGRKIVTCNTTRNATRSNTIRADTSQTSYAVCMKSKVGFISEMQNCLISLKFSSLSISAKRRHFNITGNDVHRKSSMLT